eukprot:GGOE01065346.1.p1 GENE.GGOE01065346.1~~GGOE01065346.1.p1  ORF type:complete len:482 (+),score=92.33 GGOE01065346.1:106-1551(+)
MAAGLTVDPIVEPAEEGATPPPLSPQDVTAFWARATSWAHTVTALDSAIFKLSALTPAHVLYRGLKGKLPPSTDFATQPPVNLFERSLTQPFDGDQPGADSGHYAPNPLHSSEWYGRTRYWKEPDRSCYFYEPAFMSTTTNLSVILQPQSPFRGGIIFRFLAFSGDTLPEHPRQHFTGADVRWVSQYPLEDEVLYPHGVILCPVRASSLSGKKLFTFIPLVELHEMRHFPRQQWAGCALPVQQPRDAEANVRVMEIAMEPGHTPPRSPGGNLPAFPSVSVGGLGDSAHPFTPQSEENGAIPLSAEMQGTLSIEIDAGGRRQVPDPYTGEATQLAFITLATSRKIHGSCHTACNGRPNLEAMHREAMAGTAEDRDNWHYVMEAAATEVDDRDVGHGGQRLADFLRHPIAVACGLTIEEVVALRMYTGPSYASINASLRVVTGIRPELLDRLARESFLEYDPSTPIASSDGELSPRRPLSGVG